MEQHEMTSHPLLDPNLAYSHGPASFSSSTGGTTGKSTPDTTNLIYTVPKTYFGPQHSVREAQPVPRKKAFSVWPLPVRLWATGWTAETLSCIFAAAALAGLVATLLAHQGKPIPDWPRLVSINSIVSLFSLMIRGGVCFVLAEGISQAKWQWYGRKAKLIDMHRFDSASRGAWGSFVFLCRPKVRGSYWIPALGALIMIMASLTGFLTQQIIVFEDCLQKDGSASAGVWRANSFDRSGMTTGPLSWDAYPPMLAAINIGIIQPMEDRTTLLTQGCNTGNCTLPSDHGASFSSIGVGHQCVNVTSELQFSGNGRNLSVALGDLSMYLSAADSFTTRAYEKSIKGPITQISFIYRPPIMSISGPREGVAAVNCSIFPVINTYGVNITNSIMEETLVDSLPMAPFFYLQDSDAEEDLWASYRSATSHTFRNGTQQPCERSDKPKPGFLRVDGAMVDKAAEYTSSYLDDSDYANVEIAYYPADCVWTLWKPAVDGIVVSFVEIFNDQTLGWTGRLGGNGGSVQLRQLYQAGNISFASIDSVFANVTTAMNTVIRTNGKEGADAMAKADVWYTTTCIQISWVWLSFPAIMIALCAVFLGLVAVYTRGVPSERLWKSSILATLFCEVDEDVLASKPVGKREMDDVAYTTSVSLDSNVQTLRLVGVSKGMP